MWYVPLPGAGAVSFSPTHTVPMRNSKCTGGSDNDDGDSGPDEDKTEEVDMHFSFPPLILLLKLMLLECA